MGLTLIRYSSHCSCRCCFLKIKLRLIQIYLNSLTEHTHILALQDDVVKLQTINLGAKLYVTNSKQVTLIVDILSRILLLCLVEVMSIYCLAYLAKT